MSNSGLIFRNPAQAEAMEFLCILCDRYIGNAGTREFEFVAGLLQHVLPQPIIAFSEEHSSLCPVCGEMVERYLSLRKQIQTSYRTIAKKYGHTVSEVDPTPPTATAVTQTAPYTIKEKKISCCLCSSQMKNKSILEEHLKSHSQSLVECQHCESSFKDASLLQDHSAHCLLRNDELQQQRETTGKKKQHKAGPVNKRNTKRKKMNPENENNGRRLRRDSKIKSKVTGALKEAGNLEERDFVDSDLIVKASGLIPEGLNDRDGEAERNVGRSPDIYEFSVEKASPQNAKFGTQGRNICDNDSAHVRKYECDICSLSCNSLASLQRHAAVHSDVKPYRCDVCDASFKWSYSLASHYRIHSAVKPFSCKWCSQTFRQKGTLKQHLRSHTGEKQFQCRFCDSGFTRSSRLKIHEMSHTGERPYKCDQCEAAFADPQIYKKHKMNHEGVKPHTCNICGKAFVMARYLNEHMKKHTGERRYLCAVCAQAFPNAGRLQRHMLVHSRTKRFQCEICDRDFMYKEALNEHLDIHVGAKPYLCNECGKCFTHRTGLKQHRSVHSPEKNQTCEVCFKCFKSKSRLNLHMKKVHPMSIGGVVGEDSPLWNGDSPTKGSDAVCPVIEIVPLSTNIEDLHNAVITENDVTQNLTNHDVTKDPIQPLIQAINQTLASKNGSDETMTSQGTDDDVMTVKDDAVTSQYAAVGLLQQAAGGSAVYQVVSPGGEVLYQSADNDLIKQLTDSSTPDVGVSDVGVTIMQIQVPSVQQEIQIPNN